MRSIYSNGNVHSYGNGTQNHDLGEVCAAAGLAKAAVVEPVVRRRCRMRRTRCRQIMGDARSLRLRQRLGPHGYCYKPQLRQRARFSSDSLELVESLREVKRKVRS